MSDEIEIEEHDLLDDPTVRNIFPDISRLKQEILDYEYNEDPDFQNPEPSSTTSEPSDSIKNAKHFDNDSKPSIMPPVTTNNLCVENKDHSNGFFIRKDKDPDFQNPEPSSTTSEPSDSIKNAENFDNDSKPSIISPATTNNLCVENKDHSNGFKRKDKGIEMHIHSNKIILGSKPINANDKADNFETNIKPFCAVVALENCGLFLNSSSRFCKHCRIFFPTNQEYSKHEELYHFESANVTNNQEGMVEQKKQDINPRGDCNNEQKILQQKTKNMSIGVNEENTTCNICNTHFKFKKYLKVHLMRIHKISKQKLSVMFKDERRKPSSQEEITPEAKRNECFHCKKSFRTQNLLIEHIYSILQTPKNGSDNANKIVIGKKTNVQQNSNNMLDRNFTEESLRVSLNKNINQNAEASMNSRGVDTQQLLRYFRCNFCLLYFKTTKYFVRHMANKHKIVKNFQLVKVSFDPKCVHCPKLNENVDKYNAHLHKNHSNKIREAIYKSRKVTNDKTVKNFVSKDASHNIFYKCDYCCLYFNNLTFFTRHVSIKHKVVKISKKKVIFDPKCKFCKGSYPTVKRYNKHVYRTHSAICNQIAERSRLISDKKESSTASNTKIMQNSDLDMEVLRCKFCPMYFKTMKFFTQHLANKHNILNIPKTKREIFCPKCKFCPKTCDSVIKYNDHLNKRHFALLNKMTVKSTLAKGSAYTYKDIKLQKFKVDIKIDRGKNSKDVVGKSQIECNRCYFCPMYFMSTRYYIKHLKIKHNTAAIPKAKKVIFNPKCEYCPSSIKSVKAYNRHIFMRHKPLHSYIEAQKDLASRRFYRCCYCSHYFNSFNVYNSHVVRKHRVKRAHHAKKVEFDPNCKYCSIEAVNEIAYNKHLCNSHRNRVDEVFTGRVKEKKTLSKNTSSIASVPKLYTNKIKSCDSSTSMNTENEFTNFSSNIIPVTKTYTNKHKSSVSPDSKTTENLNSNMIPILKSALFKCHKCDIHFLTVKNALDHTNHMEMLINWKCSLCNRIFKQNDKWLHGKQHLYSHVFTVYDLNTANISHILYKCTKCTIHFDESVENHHSECALKIPQSYNCEICDILIDCNAKICHEYNHKHRNLTSNDFIIIETDVVFDDNTSKIVNLNKSIAQIANNTSVTQKNNLKRKISKAENTEVQNQPKKLKERDEEMSTNNTSKDDSSSISINQQRFDKMSLKLSFCNTCKSFVSIIGQKRKEHAKGLCAKLPTLVCKDCGLRFTCKTLSTHRQVHLRNNNLKLQHFKFYAFNSGKRVLPPMPEYEKCVICDVNFISKSSLGQHICSDDDFSVCNICNIKLFKPVFHLHMAFHKYKMTEANSTSTSNNAVVREQYQTYIKKRNEQMLLVLFCCKVCNVHMNTYDRLIEHCQKHCFNNFSIETEECEICKLKIEDSSVKTHAKSHEIFGVPSFDKFYVDPFYFRFDNKVWLNHVFGSHPKAKVQEIIQSSAYLYEHRFKMYITQEGRYDLTLYKCDKCNRFVEPDIIYHHIANFCSSLRKYPCPICHLDFISSFSLTRHKITHEDPKVTLKSYRILHFNRQQDSEFNAVILGPHKLYVLHQCRHCNGIIDSMNKESHVCDENGLKDCTDCGLMISNEIYEHHTSKHKTLDSFISDNIKVILFGIHELHNKKNMFTSKTSFRGKVHDYSFYKCSNCQICVKLKKSTVTHTCTFNNYRVACSKCGLYFFADKLVSHTKNHETDADFILENMSFIEFNPTTLKPKDDELKLSSDTSDKECAVKIECNSEDAKLNDPASIVSEEKKVSDDTVVAEVLVVEKVADIYKCTCGLHFLDESSIVEHIGQCNPKAKQAKQNCSKCGLLFTANVLFKHLLTHHGDKKISYKFNIVEKSESGRTST